MSFELDPNYVDVAERIREFRAKHPEGSLDALDAAKPYEVVEVGGRTFIVVASAAYRSPEDPHPGVGLAWEPFPGRTPYTRDSEMQNAQTSSWGRAIVAALAADTKHIASAEEVRNRRADQAPTNGSEPDPLPASDKNKAEIQERADKIKAIPGAHAALKQLWTPTLPAVGKLLAVQVPLARQFLDKIEARIANTAEQMAPAITAAGGPPLKGTEDEFRIITDYIEKEATA